MRITDTTNTLSYRCGGSPVGSGCDLLYSGIGPYVEFSMNVQNNEPYPYGFAEYMVGHATYTSDRCA